MMIAAVILKMTRKFSQLSALLVTLIAVSSIVEGKRISQIKCEEFIRRTEQETKVIPLTLNPRPIVFKSFNCSKTVDLIVGGEDAKEAEFPHQAVLGYRINGTDEYAFLCGATLISEWYVMTAAHCMRKGNASIVRLGDSNLQKNSPFQFDIDVDKVIKHPYYRMSRSYYDIALIKLKQRVFFSRHVRPACLWGDLYDNVTSVIATGFGATEEAGPTSDTLRKVQLEIMDTSECESAFSGVKSVREGIKDEQVCIGSTDGERDTCQGDSGGPIQVLLNPKGCIYHVLAITSTGVACGHTAALYTKVASYIDWIEGIVWGNGGRFGSEQRRYNLYG